jgi:hypothetical protein
MHFLVMLSNQPHLFSIKKPHIPIHLQINVTSNGDEEHELGPCVHHEE